MGTRHLLALFLVLLVLGSGECGWQRRSVGEEENEPHGLPDPVLAQPYPCPPLPALPPPAAANPLALLMHSPPAEVQGVHVPEEDEAASPALLAQMQESLYGYWDTARAAAQGLYEKTYLTTVDEKIRYHHPLLRNQESQPPAPSPSDAGAQVQAYAVSRLRFLSPQPPALWEPAMLRPQPCPP